MHLSTQSQLPCPLIIKFPQQIRPEEDFGPVIPSAVYQGQKIKVEFLRGDYPPSGERAGLPQDRLGVLAGLEESSSSARISRSESGVHEPPLSFAESLAKVLGVPAAYLSCSDDRLAEIILHYADMSEAQRRELAIEAAELAGH
ncbi:hypothetical protein ACI48D_02900 [Massilia sp. LXY-6]|uniref:hypothetical protein n=1 Tax=Massilia sp. LXY-6 TaxID=3379823 RepID=UPI003EE1244D